MTDRELLELAAKAAGIGLLRSRLDDPLWRDFLLVERDPNHPGHGQGWNALVSDGDALRLAVKLRLSVCVRGHECEVFDTDEDGDCLASEPIFYASAMAAINDPNPNEPSAATRRAIVRAAAAIAATEPQMDAQARADWTAR